MNPVEVYVIARDAGVLLYKYSIMDFEETDKDQLVSGFLSALNNFAKELDFPAGVSLIRSGSLEARFSPGEHIFTVLMIDFSMPLGASTEPILSGLAEEITEKFEEKYKDALIKQLDCCQFEPDTYSNFWEDIDRSIDQFGSQSSELYQKLVLIEAMYAKVPQKWCIPLIEKLTMGEQVDIVSSIPQQYHRQLKDVVQKINRESSPVWQIFVVSTIDPNSL